MKRSSERVTSIRRNAAMHELRHNAHYRQNPLMRGGHFLYVMRATTLNSFSKPFSLRSEIETHSRDAARFHEVLFTCELVVTVEADACRFGRRKSMCFNSRSDTKNLYIISTQARPDCVMPCGVHSCLHNDYDGGITQHDHEPELSKSAESCKQIGPWRRQAKECDAERTSRASRVSLQPRRRSAADSKKTDL